ncbi:MAG: zinc protease [Myxococcota bacterium]|jgi:zinc protease
MFSHLLLPPILLAAPLRLPHTEVTLDCGLRLIVHEDHRAPLFAAELRYHTGAADDPVPGLAHLIEHMMFEGSDAAPQGAYDRLLAAAGASNNAWTSHDTSAFTVVGPAAALELTLFLESDRMGWLTLEEEDLINQLAVVFSERELSRGAPGGLETAAVSRMLYPDSHPYRGTVLGEPETLGEVRLDTVRAALDERYQPANATLVVCGDVSTEAVIALARQYFADVPTRPPLPHPTAAPLVVDAEQRRVLFDEVEPTLLAVWPTVPRLHPDEPALDLLADALTEALSGARAWTENRRLGGRLSVRLSRPRGHTRRLLRHLDRAVKKLQRVPLSMEALARLQRRWRAGYVRSAEGLEERAALLSACVEETGEADCVEDILEQREALRPADIQAAAQRYLGAGRLLLSSMPERKRRLALWGSAEIWP